MCSFSRQLHLIPDATVPPVDWNHQCVQTCMFACVKKLYFVQESLQDWLPLQHVVALARQLPTGARLRQAFRLQRGGSLACTASMCFF